MMNADKQMLYSGVPQEDWENRSKYPRIMSNGPKPPRAPEKSRRSSGLIPFLILTGVTILISAGVVIGLHYLKYTEEEGLIFSTERNNKTSGEISSSGSHPLKPNPLPVNNKNPVEHENPDTHQNPKDEKSDHDKKGPSNPEPSGKDTDSKVNAQKPDDGKDISPAADEGNKEQETKSNTNIKSENGKDENTVDNKQPNPEGQNTNDNNKGASEGTRGDKIQNPTDLTANKSDNTTDDDDWLDIIKQDGDYIIFQKPTTPKPEVKKENNNENLPTNKDNKEISLDKKDNVISSSNEKKENKEDNKEDNKDEKEEKKEKKVEKEDKKDHEDSSLLYNAINNFAQKYFNSTNLNPTQVKELFKNLSVGPSLEVIIIASGIIFIGLSLLIIAITCLVTRTRKIKIRREKIKKAVADLEGGEKIILLTDEQSEDEYVKT